MTEELEVDYNMSIGNNTDLTDYLETTMKKMVLDMHLNSINAHCFELNENTTKIAIDPPLEFQPDLFIVSNRFEITYGASGSLVKRKVEGTASTSEIVFTFDKDRDGDDIPICYLLIEKNKNE